MTDNPVFFFFLHAQWLFFFICNLSLLNNGLMWRAYLHSYVSPYVWFFFSFYRTKKIFSQGIVLPPVCLSVCLFICMSVCMFVRKISPERLGRLGGVSARVVGQYWRQKLAQGPAASRSHYIDTNRDRVQIKKNKDCAWRKKKNTGLSVIKC